MTNKQIEIAEKLKSLVHRRFSECTLKQEIERIFQHEITLELSDDDNQLPDWNYTFSSNDCIYGGIFDVYFLKQRSKGPFGNTLYITEVGFQFGI